MSLVSEMSRWESFSRADFPRTSGDVRKFERNAAWLSLHCRSSLGTLQSKW